MSRGDVTGWWLIFRIETSWRVHTKQGSLYYQPKQCTIKGKSPKFAIHLHWFDAPKMDNWMTPAKNPPDFEVIECPTTSIQQPFLNLNIDWHHRATKKNSLFHPFFPIAFLPRLAPRSGFQSSAQFRGVVEKRVLRAGGFEFFGFVKLILACKKINSPKLGCLNGKMNFWNVITSWSQFDMISKFGLFISPLQISHSLGVFMWAGNRGWLFYVFSATWGNASRKNWPNIRLNYWKVRQILGS